MKYIFKSDYENNVFSEQKEPFNPDIVISTAASVGINIVSMKRENNTLMIETENKMSDQQKINAANFLAKFDLSKAIEEV